MKLYITSLLCSLYFSLFFFNFSTAKKHQSTPATKKCSHQLQGITYVPSNDKKSYLTTIGNELINQLSTNPQTSPTVSISIIQNFVQKYQVSVIVQPPIGTSYIYTPANNIPTPLAERLSGQIVTKPYLNLVGFNYSPENHIYSASFFLQLPSGVAATLIIELSTVSSIFQ